MGKKAKKAVKKIEVAKTWSTAKQLARKGFDKEAREDAKDFKDDADELGNLKTRARTFNDLMDSFDKGLTKKLKAAEAEKDLKKMLSKAQEALPIVKQYEKKVSQVAGKIGTPQKAQMVLSGALDRVRSRLESQIEVLTDAV